VTIRGFLAANAVRSPGNGVEPFGADLFLAMLASAKASVFNAGKRAADVSQENGFPVQVPDGQFAFAGKLNLINGVSMAISSRFLRLASISAFFASRTILYFSNSFLLMARSPSLTVCQQ